MVLASGLVAGLIHIPEPILLSAGLLLFPVAGFLVIFARAAVVPAWAVQTIVTSNDLWVIDSLRLPMTGLIAPNAVGWIFVLMQAAIVAVFAGLGGRARARGRRVDGHPRG